MGWISSARPGPDVWNGVLALIRLVAWIGVASVSLLSAESALRADGMSPEAIGAALLSPPLAPGRCEWRPPQTDAVEIVATPGELYAAVKRASAHTTILVRPGVYHLTETIEVRTPHLVLRGVAGDRSRVVLRGGGMDDRRVGVAIAIAAPHVTVADLTVGWVGYHGVQVRGERGASGAVLHNLRIVDTGQQLVKGSHGENAALHADDGRIDCSLLEYTGHAPSDYTNGIDVIGAKGWVVRDNELRRIRGPEARGWRAGPAILFWGNSIGTIVERNLIVDSYRGIAFGIGPGGTPYARDGERRFDHQGGVVRNNVVCNLHAWADEGIEANAARDVQIEHNTVLIEGRLPRSISVRFASSSGWVRNNLTNRPIVFRDGSRFRRTGNVAGATRDWFLEPENADLRLARRARPAVGAAAALADANDDVDGAPSGTGTARDAGAFEYRDRPERARP